jgi:hypothetical protein
MYVHCAIWYFHLLGIIQHKKLDVNRANEYLYFFVREVCNYAFQPSDKALDMKSLKGEQLWFWQLRRPVNKKVGTL